MDSPAWAHGGPDALPGLSRTQPRRGIARHWIEGVAAVLAGALIAMGCAGMRSSDDGASARRVSLERELSELSSPLAELARLERASHLSHESAASAAARARPYLELRALLDTLSREAATGVTVSRLRQTREGFELRIVGEDSAVCASWVARLARRAEWKSAQIVEFKFAAAPIDANASRAVEATVRLPMDLSAAGAESAQRQPIGGSDEPALRRER